MNKSLIGKRYAKAMLEVASDLNMIDKVEQDMALVKEVIKTEKSLRIFLASKLVSSEEKKSLVEKVFSDGVSKEVLNFLSLVIDKGRQGSLVDIAESFQEIADDARNIVVLDCYSAVKISEEEEEKLKKTISELINKNIKISTHINEKLLGGIIVKYKDKVIDGSIINKLDQYKRILVK